MLIPLLMSLPVVTNAYWENMLEESIAAQNRAAHGHFSQMPVEGVITGHFGERPHPILNLTRKHRGVDIAAMEGVEFHAASTGVVKYAGEAGTLGNLIVIDHGNVITRYAHAKQIKVEEGQTVRAGQVIGTVGQTGLATGPHLHFEVIVDGRHYDPMAFMRHETHHAIDTPPEKDWLATMMAPSETVQERLPVIDNFINERFMKNIAQRLDSQIASMIDHSFTNSSGWQADYPHQQQVTAYRVDSESIVHTHLSLWSLALDYIEGSDWDVYQGMLAIYTENQDAFLGNLNLRRSDKPLRLPSIDSLNAPCTQVAKERFQNDLEVFKSRA